MHEKRLDLTIRLGLIKTMMMTCILVLRLASLRLMPHRLDMRGTIASKQKTDKCRGLGNEARLDRHDRASP
jgi:hypothetical protein